MPRPILTLNKPSTRTKRKDANPRSGTVDLAAKPPGGSEFREAMRPTGAECLAQLAAHFPALFDPAAPPPLAIGIHVPMRACGMSGTQIRRALRVWTQCPEYLRALAYGGTRYGIDGEPCGEVSTWEQGQAVERLAALDAETGDG